jgi:hypothetical protein
VVNRKLTRDEENNRAIKEAVIPQGSGAARRDGLETASCCPFT